MHLCASHASLAASPNSAWMSNGDAACRFETAAREQSQSIGVVTGTKNELNWHTSSISEYKQPMSPNAAAMQKNMQCTTDQACRSWGKKGAFDFFGEDEVEDDNLLSPRSSLVGTLLSQSCTYLPCTAGNVEDMSDRLGRRSFGSTSVRTVTTTQRIGCDQSRRSFGSTLSPTHGFSKSQFFAPETPTKLDLSQSVSNLLASWKSTPNISNAHHPLLTSRRTAGDACTMCTPCIRGTPREVDPRSVVHIYYRHEPKTDVEKVTGAHMASVNSLRELRRYLANVHRVVIPQISLFTYDTATRFGKDEIDIMPPPCNRVLCQVLPRNMLSLGPTFFEHCCAGDYEKAGSFIENPQWNNQTDLDTCLHYFTYAAKCVGEEGKEELSVIVRDHHGSVEGLEMLLDANADINSYSSDVSADYTGNGMNCTPLINAIVNHRFDIVRCLLERSADVTLVAEVTPGSNSFISALSAACEQGNREMMRLLHKYGAVAEESTKCDPSMVGVEARVMPPLHVAVSSPRCSKVGIISMLVEWNANVERLHDGVTPLFRCLEKRNAPLVEELLQCGAKANRVCHGLTSIHVACWTDDIESVTHLLSFKADVNTQTMDKTRLTPLHIATRVATASSTSHGHENRRNSKQDPCALLRFLIERGAYVNARDDAMETPLAFAMKHGAGEVIMTLIKANAEPAQQKKEQTFQTALDLARTLPVTQVMHFASIGAL